jgi:hypothetical protein
MTEKTNREDLKKRMNKHYEADDYDDEDVQGLNLASLT